METTDWLLIGIILVLVILALCYIRKHKGGCSGCHGDCGSCKKKSD